MRIDIRIVGHNNLNVDLCHSGSVFDRNNRNFADIYSHPVFKRKVFQTEKKCTIGLIVLTLMSIASNKWITRETR